MREDIIKTVYFVRHGESESNVLRINNPDSPLTSKGIQQAQYLAKRFSGSIKTDKIISSTYRRAKETSEILSKVIGNGIECSDLFVERSYPSSFNGQSWDSKESKKFHKDYDEKYQNRNWRHSDEETFYKLRERGLKALQFLTNQEEGSLLVVSHGVFIRVILAVMMSGEDVSIKHLYNFVKFFRSTNTGITVCQLYEHENWKSLTYNDNAHLGEVKE